MYPDYYNTHQTTYHQKCVLLWALTIIMLTFAIFILHSCTNQTPARAQEPDWDKLVPIVIQIESSGNPYAVSEDGCIGLMQISRVVLEEWNNDPENKKWNCGFNKCINNQRADSDLFLPFVNEMIGTWYLKRIWYHYLPHYGIPQTIENMLTAYNWGIGNLVKYRQGKIELPKETKRYLEKYKKLEKIK